MQLSTAKERNYPYLQCAEIQRPDGSDLIVEVEQHIGEQTVRCVAMDTTDGLTRGMKVVDLQRPLAMPTGNQVKGRLMNVMGNASTTCGSRLQRGSPNSSPSTPF